MVDGERLHEVGCVRHDRLFHAVEANLDGTGFHAGAIKHVLEADSSPARVAHGAVRPLSTGHARLKVTARIAGTLVDGSELHLRECHEVVEGKRQASVDMAMHRQAEA